MRFFKIMTLTAMAVMAVVAFGNGIASPENQKLGLENEAEALIFKKVGIPADFREPFSTVVESRGDRVEVCFSLRASRQYQVPARYRVLVSETCEVAPDATTAAERIGSALKGAF